MDFAGWLLLIPAVILGVLGMPAFPVERKAVLSWAAVLAGVMGVSSAGIYLAVHTTATARVWLTVVAWAWLVSVALLILWVEAALGRGLRLPLRILLSLACAGAFSLLAVSAWMWESRFSEEEFFVAVSAVILAVQWWLVWLVVTLAARYACLPDWRLRRGLPVQRSALAAVFAVFMIVDGLWMVNRYQDSFYPRQVAAPFPGISEQSPFLCDQVSPEQTVYRGKETWERYLKLVEKNPKKGPPEYGMLAIALNSEAWARQFHDSLIREAGEAQFTGPANSIKIGQYYAAQRAYYYPKVRDAFPGLFTPAEQSQVQDWFGAINRRTLTIEWVDWMYAVAFTQWPEGPYENQENGAGFLAMIKKNGLENPDLAQANSDYLRRNQRGWLARFHNTDDAIMYQPIWITNAYFQYLLTGRVDEEKMRQAFEWLLSQALPNGGDLQYNHPEGTSFVGTAYLGAALLKDGRYLWLAGRGIETLEEQGGSLEAQPGIEQPVLFDSTPPETGSCLIYGDSGLPNQVGPLAPDKLVIRNGWGDDALYMLINLRFTGWHRYKATNTVTFFHHREPAVIEINSTEKTSWLPAGRSAFRDKRIPRENLNGLSVERAGLSRVLNTLTGMGNAWEQDPPFYAQVTAFGEDAEFHLAQVDLPNWHGWAHSRQFRWTDDGLVVVVDWVQRPPGGKGSIFWHLRGEAAAEAAAKDRVRLGSAPSRDELVLLPSGAERLAIHEDPVGPQGTNLTAEYQIPDEGGRLVSVFLTGAWSGANAQVESRDGREVIRISSTGKEVEIPLQEMMEAGAQ